MAIIIVKKGGDEMSYHYHLNKVFMREPLKFEDTRLFQIGRLYCKSNSVIEPHVHGNLFEITVVTDGAGKITTNGQTQPVGRGDIYLSFPCDTHSIASDAQKPLKYDFFAFASDHKELHNDLEKIMLDFHSPMQRVIRDERILTLLGNAIAEIDGERIYSEALLSAIFRQIIIYLIRCFHESDHRQVFHTATPKDALCYRLMNYVDTHVFSLRSLNELSSQMGYSYAYLSTVFKQTTDQSLSSYYRKKKMEIAAILIKENRMTVSEIAELLGYSSVYAFSKAFTNGFGCSPLAYRKKIEQ